MSDLDDHRRARKAAHATFEAAAKKVDDLVDAEDSTEEAIAAAVDEMKAAEAEFDKQDGKVKRAEKSEAMRLAATAPARGDLGATTPSAPAAASNPDHKGVEVGIIAQAVAVSGGNAQLAAMNLERAGHSGLSAALNTGTPAAGGVTIPDHLASPFIEMLRPKVVVRRAGARTSPMPAGQMRRARQTGGATASYGAEMAVITSSEPTFDEVSQTFKKLSTMVKVSNNLLNMSSLNMAMMVRDDMLKEMALKEDAAFIRFDGTANTPIGIRNWAATWNAGPIAATVTAADQAIRKAISNVEDSDVGLINPGWIMRGGAKSWLAGLKDANGNKMYPEIDASGTLAGHPIYTTSQIPNNLGTGTDETEVYFVEFSEAMIGEAGTLRIAQSEQATVGGENLFERDMTAFRAITEHDFALMHGEAASGFNGQAWSL